MTDRELSTHESSSIRGLPAIYSTVDRIQTSKHGTLSTIHLAKHGALNKRYQSQPDISIVTRDASNGGSDQEYAQHIDVIKTRYSQSHDVLNKEYTHNNDASPVVYSRPRDTLNDEHLQSITTGSVVMGIPNIRNSLSRDTSPSLGVPNIRNSLSRETSPSPRNGTVHGDTNNKNDVLDASYPFTSRPILRNYFSRYGLARTQGAPDVDRESRYTTVGDYLIYR